MCIELYGIAQWIIKISASCSDSMLYSCNVMTNMHLILIYICIYMYVEINHLLPHNLEIAPGTQHDASKLLNFQIRAESSD